MTLKSRRTLNQPDSNKQKQGFLFPAAAVTTVAATVSLTEKGSQMKIMWKSMWDSRPRVHWFTYIISSKASKGRETTSISTRSLRSGESAQTAVGWGLVCVSSWWKCLILNMKKKQNKRNCSPAFVFSFPNLQKCIPESRICLQGLCYLCILSSIAMATHSVTEDFHLVCLFYTSP